MKKIYVSLCILILIGACRGPEGLPGPQGPRGPQGQDGYDGEDGTAYLFEINFDFISNSGYNEIFDFPNDFGTEPTDIVLVYLLWQFDDQGNDVWRLLPQSEIMEFGWLQYNYDYTQFDVQIFMQADFSLDKLGPAYTHDQWARIVVIPGQPMNFRMNQDSIDFSDYNAVKEAYGLPDLPSPKNAQ